MLYRDLIDLGRSLTSEDQDRLKCQLKNASYSYIYSYDYSKQKRILTKEEWMPLNDLRRDSSIVNTKPDKGNAFSVLIVNRHDYLTKMKQLISDGTNNNNNNTSFYYQIEKKNLQHINISIQKKEFLLSITKKLTELSKTKFKLLSHNPTKSRENSPIFGTSNEMV